MPDRLIRDELLESERWLALPDNTARVCYIALLLQADAFGNMDAGAGRLRRLWRDYGPESPEDIARMVITLAKVDLVREYAADGKPYLHIPRYRQNLRYTKRTYPQDPWTEREQQTQQKQTTKNNSPRAHKAHTQSAHGAHGRSEVKGSDVKQSDSKPVGSFLQVPKAQAVDNSTPKGAIGKSAHPKGNGQTHDNATGQQWNNPAWVAATAKLLDLRQAPGEHDSAFRDRVHGTLQAKLATAKHHQPGSDPQ